MSQVTTQTPYERSAEGHTIDTRPRRTRMVAPLVMVGGLALGTLYVALVDPNEPGHYPLCPTKALAGLDCPGCGGLRATHDLAHGDILGALGHNALWVLAVPSVLFLLGRTVYFAWTGKRPTPTSERTAKWSMIALTALVVFFTVVRNLPFGDFLASG